MWLYNNFFRICKSKLIVARQKILAYHWSLIINLLKSVRFVHIDFHFRCNSVVPIAAGGLGAIDNSTSPPKYLHLE